MYTIILQGLTLFIVHFGDQICHFRSHFLLPDPPGYSPSGMKDLHRQESPESHFCLAR